MGEFLSDGDVGDQEEASLPGEAQSEDAGAILCCAET
jgi:hypothetical protein